MNTTKELTKNIAKLNHYTTEQFEKDARQYIDAIKERRMLCSIISVASSGMSRVLKFVSCEQGTNGYWYSNYYALFKALGHTPTKDGFRVSGCGMDMIFATNYNIMHEFKTLGIITKEECEQYAQMTPTTI